MTAVVGRPRAGAGRVFAVAVALQPDGVLHPVGDHVEVGRGLLDVVHHADAQGVDRRAERRIRGHQYAGAARLAFTDLLDQIEAVRAHQVAVDQGAGELLIVEEPQGALGVLRHREGEPRRAQRPLHDAEHHARVIDQQHGRAADQRHCLSAGQDSNLPANDVAGTFGCSARCSM